MRSAQIEEMNKEVLGDKENQQANDEIIIQKEYDTLINDYLNSNHRKKVDIIKTAFDFAKNAHQGVRRRSGEPYILHPLAVARIVCHEIGLGSTSIAAALLHDVVEDTEYTVEDISKIFGPRIATIVDGLTKISSGMFGDNVSVQAENFRKLLLTMSDDIRVILIKIADRLHNMRTLGSMAPVKQYKISGETMYIYAPLAHRLGLFAIKTELEELSFKWENPEMYNEIVRKLGESHSERSNIYEIFASSIIKKLDELNFKYEIKAREKSVFSIWNKMQTKGVPFEDIYDLFAVRIIFENEPNVDEKKRCWDIYSVITDLFKLKPDRIRDWVSRPKANGYQALHLTVMGPMGNWIEVQIRSRKMNDIAEKGFAAHWKYKEGNVEEDTELNKWLHTIKEILENPSPNALDFLDTIKLNLFAQEIFVFTPKGELKTLAQGASALDLAYTIHTKVGNHAIGAKVNHKLVPLSHKLNSGDQIEILTSKNSSPKEEWLGFVSTAKAKNNIDLALKKQRKVIINKGEEMLASMLQTVKIDPSVDVLDAIVEFYKLEDKEQLYYEVGAGNVKLSEKFDKILNNKKVSQDNLLVKYVKQAFKGRKKSNNGIIEQNPEYEKINTKKTYVLREDSFAHNFRVANCCKPVAGDKVFGFVNLDNTVDVHNIHCQVGLKLKASQGDRIVELVWSDAKYPFLSALNLKGIDRLGIVKSITEAINESNLNMKSIMLDAENGIFSGYIVLYVRDIRDINKIIKKIQKIDGITSVTRIQNL